MEHHIRIQDICLTYINRCVLLDKGHDNSTGESDRGSAKYQKLDSGQKWSTDFEPREQNKEKSRNCQHVDKEIKELIINTVFKKVLESDVETIRNLSDGRCWRKGGNVDS